MKSRPAVDRLECRRLLSAAAVAVDLSVTHQTIHGFGAAMIDFKAVPEYHDAAFFDRIVNDLGATEARVPIPPGFENANDDADPNHFDWSGFDFQQLDYSMDFLKQLQDRGVQTFMMTPWTPPYWMKTSRSHDDGGQLRPDVRDEYAEYLAAIVIAARDHYGIEISAISIQNEPIFVEPYNSAIYNPNQMRETLRAVQRKFTAEGLTTKIILPEDISRADRIPWYVEPAMTDPETQNANVIFAGHSLQNAADLDSMHQQLAPYGREFWMTETSGHQATWSGAMSLAQQMQETLVHADASLWSYWQWSDTSDNSQYALMVDGNPTSKYWVSRQYYRYIRPGAQRVDANSSDSNLLVSSFRNPASGAVTMVLVNTSADASDTTIHLDGANLPAGYRVIRSSSTENGIELSPVNSSNDFQITIPGQSVVTLYSGADFAPVTGGAMTETFLPINPYETGTLNALARGALKGYVDSVTAILADPNTDVNAAAPDGTTALHSAMANPGKTAATITSMLLAAGADVNAVTSDGWTPLHAAAANTFMTWKNDATIPLQRLQMLLDAGANPNAKDSHDRTPLHLAAMMGKTTWDTFWLRCDPSLVQALIDAGADVNAIDDAGMTALDYATREGYEPIRQALIAAGAIDSASIYGTIFNDKNSNGVFDGVDTKLNDWFVYLDLNNNGTRDAHEPAAKSDPSGHYAFFGLADGAYHVKVRLNDGYRKTTPASGIKGFDVAITSGSVSKDNNLGATRNIRVAGKVTDESTGQTIAGIVINIVAGETIIATRTTDAAGFWQVKGLPAGSGEVIVVAPSGFQVASPSSGSYAGAMTSGQQIANLNFSLAPIAAAALGSIRNQVSLPDDDSIVSATSDLVDSI